MSARLTLVAPHDDPEPPAHHCWCAPSLWLPDGGLRNSATTLGVRYDCHRCKLSGPAQFGPARWLAAMAMRAEVQFIEAFADRCPAVDLDGELDEDFYPG